MTLRPPVWLVAVTVLSTGCGKKEPALGVTVVVAKSVAATCLRVELLADGPAPQPAKLLPAAKADGTRSLRVGIIRGKLPASVTLRVTALAGGATCDSATVKNLVEEKAFTFPAEGTAEQSWSLSLSAAADQDGDGFSGLTLPGQSKPADCVDDPAQGGAAIFPGAPSVCAMANVDFDCNGLAGCADPACSASAACTSAPTVLAFRNNPLGVALGACSDLLRVESRAGATATPVAADTVVGLSAPGLTLYAGPDAQCTGAAITSATLAAGTSELTLRFTGATAGSFPVTASAPGFTSAMQTQTVSGKSAVAVRFAANTGQAQLKAGDCSSPFVLELLDVDGALAPAPAGGLSITLGHAPARSLTFYAAAGCAVSDALPGGSLGVGAGATSSRFWVRALGVGATALTASLQGSAPQQALTVTPGDPAKLVFLPPTLALGTGDCSPALAVAVTDAFGNPTVTAQAVTVALDGQDAALTLHAPSGNCGAALTPAQVGLAAAAPQSDGFALKGSAAKTYSVKATAPGLMEGLLPVSVGAGPPATVVIAPAVGNTPAGTCIAGVQVTLKDASGQDALNASGTTLTLSATAGGNCTLGTDASCGGGNQLSIPANQSTGTYSIRCTAAGNWTTSATFPGAAAAGTRTDTFVALAPSKLAVLTAPQQVGAGACSAAVEVEARDTFDNPSPVGPTGAGVTVTFTPNQDLAAFDGNGCTGGAVAFPASSTRAQLSLRSNKVGSWAVAASTAFATAATVQHTVVAAGASKLTLTPTAAQSFAVGACGPQLTVKRYDAFDNDVTSGVTTVPLVASNGAVLEAVGGASCVGAVVSSIDIPNGSAGAPLLLRGKAAGSSSLTANLFAAPPSVMATVGGLPADALDITPTSANGTVGVGCDGFTVRAVRGGVPSAPASNLTIALTSSTNSVGLFSDATCATVATSVGISTAQTGVTFYARATAAVANALLTASAGAASGLNPFSVVASYSATAPLGTLTLSTAGGSTLEAGECRQVTATRAPASGSLTIALATAPAQTAPRVGLQTFSNNNCTTPVSTASFGGNGATTTFYVKALTGGSYTATAQASAFTDGVLALTVSDLVRRPQVSIADGQSDGLSATFPAVLSRTFLVFQAVNFSGTNDSPADANVRCGLVGPAAGQVQVSCHREGTSGAVTVAAQVVTLPASTGISVAHMSSTRSAGQNTPWFVLLAGQQATSLLLFSQSTSGTINAADDFWSAESQSDVSVQVEQSSPSNGNFTTSGGVSLQRVRLSGASVERGTVSGTGGGLSSGMIQSRALERSIALFTARSADTADAGENLAICRRRLRANLSLTQLSFTRGDGAAGACTNNIVDKVGWERAFLPTFAAVQSTDITMADTTGETPSSGGLTAVDPSRSILLSASQGPGGQAGGETSYATNDLIGAALAVFSFDNDTTVRARRGNSTGSARFTVQVVTLSP